MEIDRKNLYWMLVDQIPEKIRQKIENYQFWLEKVGYYQISNVVEI
jgi:hypothetical protein